MSMSGGPLLKRPRRKLFSWQSVLNGAIIGALVAFRVRWPVWLAVVTIYIAVLAVLGRRAYNRDRS